MKRRLTLVTTLLLAWLFVPVGLALATAYGSPSQASVRFVYAYRGVEEDYDQLYIAAFRLNYTVSPDEGADEGVILRLLDETGAELATTNPYAFYDDGWSSGVVSFYFSAARAPTWAGSYSVEMTGNPAWEWIGGTPWKTANETINYADYEGQLTALVVLFAEALEDVYSLSMSEIVAGESKLTQDYGEPYFETVIPGLREMAPSLFISVVDAVNVFDRTHDQAHATAMETQLEDGGPFDLAALETTTSISEKWWRAIIFLIATHIGVAALLAKLRSPKPASFLYGVIMIGGSVTGFMPFLAGIMCGVAGGLALVFAVFYRPSAA